MDSGRAGRNWYRAVNQCVGLLGPLLRCPACSPRPRSASPYWINDGLVGLCFLLVRLQIKREMLDGQLAGWSRRALPGIAAAGGMLVPGRRVPSSLKIFLAALAIIDDLGAVMVAVASQTKLGHLLPESASPP